MPTIKIWDCSGDQYGLKGYSQLLVAWPEGSEADLLVCNEDGEIVTVEGLAPEKLRHLAEQCVGIATEMEQELAASTAMAAPGS